MGASHAKGRLYDAPATLTGRGDSPRAGSRPGSARSRDEGSEVADRSRREGSEVTARSRREGSEVSEQPEATDGPRLTEEDKKYLQETWRTLEADPTTVGIITFSQLFEENPNMKNVFEGFRQIEMEDIRASQELKQYAARVMGFVNKIISRLDSEEKYEALMTDLGCRHMTYGAKPQYIDLMGQQFIMVIRPSLVEANQWSDGAEAAWRKLFQVISHSMKAGLQKRQSVSKETATPSRQAALSLSRGASDVTKGTSDVTRTA